MDMHREESTPIIRQSPSSKSIGNEFNLDFHNLLPKSLIYDLNKDQEEDITVDTDENSSDFAEEFGKRVYLDRFDTNQNWNIFPNSKKISSVKLN